MIDGTRRVRRPGTMRISSSPVMATLFCLLATACGGGGDGAPVEPPPPPPPAVETIDLSVTSATLTISGRLRITATPRDRNGTPVSGTAMTWSSQSSVASVSGSGEVTGVQPGSATITVSSGGKSANLAVTVVNAAPGSVVANAPRPVLALGQSFQLQAMSFDSEGVGSPLAGTWTIADPGIAAVSSPGSVTGLSPGASTLTLVAGNRTLALSLTVIAFREVATAGQDVSRASPPAPLARPGGAVCAVSGEGALFCAGGGYGAMARQLLPEVKFTVLDGSTSGFCAVGSNSAAYCWLTGDLPQLVPGSVKFQTVVTGGGGPDCGITALGEAWCWDGLGGWVGALGNGTLTTSATPVRVQSNSRFSEIVSGPYRACALTTAASIECWGLPLRIGNQGQGGYISFLGRNKNADTALVAVPAESPATFLAIGKPTSDWTCALTVSGQPHCWGMMRNIGPSRGINDCGLNPNGCNNAPQPIETNLRFTQLTSSGLGTCGLTGGGAIACWGRNLVGELGLSVGQTPLCPLAGNCLGEPTLMPGVFKEVSGGGDNVCAIDIQGRAVCWGSNLAGQLTSAQAGTATATPTLFSVDPTR